VKAAANLINSMDESINPCDDFFQFACGQFMEQTTIPDHKSDYGTFAKVAETLEVRLRRIFESKSDPTEPKAYANVRGLYQSCMDTEAIKKSSEKELKAIIESLGGWPVLDGTRVDKNFKWLEKSFDAWEKGFNFEGLIAIDVVTDQKDATKRILEIDQPNLGLSREYLMEGKDAKSVKAYLNYMVDIAALLGADRALAEKDMAEALDLELQVAEISLPKEERRNKTALYNLIPVKDLSALYPLPWLSQLNRIVADLQEEESVNVAVPEYLTKLKGILTNASPRAIANLLMWRHVQFAVDFLPEEAGAIKLEFDKVIHGKGSKSPRWEQCAKKTAGVDGNGEAEEDYFFYLAEGSLTNAVGSMYAKVHFPESKKEIIDDIVQKIRTEFRVMLQEVDWMDDDTRERALKKADLIKSHIAYSKEILDSTVLDDYYKGLTLKKSSGYLRNILLLKQWINAYYSKEFRLRRDPQSWKTHGGAAIANAYYEAEENSINFPAGFLDGVFFQEDRPLYMNYGSIGVVVGHEITHGFDDSGSQSDAYGVLVDWWEPETKKLYVEKTQCVIDQFSNFTVEVLGETLNLNGINTQGENVADLGGVKEAIRTYEKIVERWGEEPRLPGLSYSPRQLFWVSYARNWCSVRREAALKNQVLTDPHAPARFRINGPLANMQKFSEDWSCPLGSPMNPVKKCEVW